MSFSRMKPLPRFLVIIAGVAALVVGAKFGLQFLPKSEPAPVAAGAVTVPAEKSDAGQAAIAATPAPAPAAPPITATPTPTEAPSGLKPAGGQDAGLDAVLKAGKK